jgi:hypothetical protein
LLLSEEEEEEEEEEGGGGGGGIGGRGKYRDESKQQHNPTLDWLRWLFWLLLLFVFGFLLMHVQLLHSSTLLASVPFKEEDNNILSPLYLYLIEQQNPVRHGTTHAPSFALPIHKSRVKGRGKGGKADFPPPK